MMKKLKEQILANERAFYATLVCLSTLIINLFYNIYYNANANPVISFFPIIMWIAYDGNEHEKATVQGYWIWVLALIITSFVLITYPLF